MACGLVLKGQSHDSLRQRPFQRVYSELGKSYSNQVAGSEKSRARSLKIQYKNFLWDRINGTSSTYFKRRRIRNEDKETDWKSFCL